MEVRSRVRWVSPHLRYWDRFVLVLAASALAWLFWRNALINSREIDGTRYFLLDDDMMISMRYARNLAEGQGLVWNHGERVEGYTNFLWTAIMAAVHLLPISAAKIALAVRAIGFVLVCGAMALSMRIVRLFAPRAMLATPLMLTCFVSCVDILHWSVWGFETSLMTFLLLLFLDLTLERRLPFVGYLALSLLPLVRGDGLHVFLGGALVALILARDPKRAAIMLALALAPCAMHLAFRRWYYGEWLPNTYYLKVYKLDGTFSRGALYARSFMLRYAVPLILAAGSALSIVRFDRRAVVFFVTVGGTLFYVVTTGGDMFGNFRFLAHIMPVIFVFASVGVATVMRGSLGALVWACVLFVVSFPLVRPLSALVALDTNGDPYEQIQVAMLIRKHAGPDTTVAVIPAGIVPYFTRLRAIDVLGKSDKHIARLTPFPGSMVGHGKLDPSYSLASKPDLVISCRSNAIVQSLPEGSRSTDVVLSFLSSRAFQTTYRSTPIVERFTLERTTIYTHPSSPLFTSRDWASLSVRP